MRQISMGLVVALCACGSANPLAAPCPDASDVEAPRDAAAVDASARSEYLVTYTCPETFRSTWVTQPGEAGTTAEYSPPAPQGPFMRLRPGATCYALADTTATLDWTTDGATGTAQITFACYSDAGVTTARLLCEVRLTRAAM